MNKFKFFAIMDDDDLGFDGPDIRPPQASKGPLPGGGPRNFGSGRTDRDRRQGHNGNYNSNSNLRGSRNNQVGSSRDRQGGRRHGNAPGSYNSAGHRGAQNFHGRDRMNDK